MMESCERDLLPAQHAQESDREKSDHEATVMAMTLGAWQLLLLGNSECINEEDEDCLKQENQHHVKEVEIQDQDVQTDEEKHQWPGELGRPRTPEPAMGIYALLNGDTPMKSPSREIWPGLDSVASYRTRNLCFVIVHCPTSSRCIVSRNK